MFVSVPIMMEETMEFLETRQGKDANFKYEVIIVDDGSKDKTSQVTLDSCLSSFFLLLVII